MNYVHGKEAEDQFQRLSDDVVVNIFDKVSDVKWLFRCLVVSKRFSYLIPLVRSLNLDLVSDFNTDNDSVFKWGAKLTSNLGSITFLYAASLTKMMDSEEEETENEITQEELVPPLFLAIECLGEAMLWVGILSRAVRQYPMLQSITITDSMNKGVRLYLGGEKLVEYRDAFRNARKCLKEAVSRPWAGYVPVLRLPMSGYVMKRVTIVQFKLYSGDDSEANLAMVDAFVEEQGVFSEAVVQILKNHKDNFVILLMEIGHTWAMREAINARNSEWNKGDEVWVKIEMIKLGYCVDGYDAKKILRPLWANLLQMFMYGIRCPMAKTMEA
ncbi:hypothetical protein RHGRI_038009 [Rhododendron griersonianum]|uniref:F-box domain-containing protein n=1 Tax=Rhododendron griersonianum TaxID=479676 RepID=A0AAV6HUG8_9ERIC|nr:hypothetical protein RHGRI_038009 [Rhododendron griersonianum]